MLGRMPHTISRISYPCFSSAWWCSRKRRCVLWDVTLLPCPTLTDRDVVQDLRQAEPRVRPNVGRVRFGGLGSLENGAVGHVWTALGSISTQNPDIYSGPGIQVRKWALRRALKAVSGSFSMDVLLGIDPPTNVRLIFIGRNEP